MKLTELAERLNLDVRSTGGTLDREVTGGYASDLLSDVIANSKEGDVWITLQVHQNIVAVASLRDLAGIVLVNGREPDPDTVERAKKEAVAIMVSDMPTFELAGKMYALGLPGTG